VQGLSVETGPYLVSIAIVKVILRDLSARAPSKEWIGSGNEGTGILSNLKTAYPWK
jgi:hypothetical protein